MDIHEGTLQGPGREPRGRILCVDDEANMLLLLSIGLGRHFSVVTAESGAQGLVALAAQGPFDVVVSDLRMPGMSGTAFLAQVRVIAPGAARIILSGDASPSTVAAATADGALFRFLKKPCPLPEIMLVLAEAVDSARAGILLDDIAS